MMGRKGQYSVVEQVLLFALGISITIGFMVAFDSLGGDIRGEMAKSQTELVAEYVASSSIELVEGDSEGSFVIDLPSRIAGQSYAVSLGGEGVVVETVGARAETSLKGLENSVETIGAVEAGKGTTALVYEDEKLELVVE